MSRFVSPPLEELDTLRTPLNEGERIALDFFLRNLPESWEIYIQPHLNGLRPDFVLLNPHVGIAVYEVKDWNLKAMPYRIERKNGTPQLWSTNSAGKDFLVTDNPVDKVIHYRDQIVNLYVPQIGQNSQEINTTYLAVVTAGVMFTNATTEEVTTLLEPLYKKYSTNARKYLPLVGIDDIKANINLLNVEADELNIWPVTLTWIQSSSEQVIPQLCTQAVLDIPNLAKSDTVAWTDITLLLPDHTLGLSCVNLLEEQNFNVLHIFDPDRQEQKSKKMAFFMGAAQIKACTIHSFKGWEARYMVIAITESTDLSLAYVAMSRLKRDAGGSYLTVVCSNPALENYGKTWPSFSRLP